MENASQQPPGFHFPLQLLFLPRLHSQSCLGLLPPPSPELRRPVTCFLRKLLSRSCVGFGLRVVLSRFLSWSCLNVGSLFCCPCSCFLTLQRLSVFPQPLTDLLSSVCVWGGFQGFPSPLPALAEGSVELFMVSWFNQVLNVAPFLSLLHIRLVFLLDFPPFYLVLVFWVRHLFFQYSCFSPLSQWEKWSQCLGACQKQLFSKQISSTLTSLRVGSSHLKSIFQISPKSKSGVDSHYCVLALTPSSVSHPPFSCPSCPSSVCSRPVPQDAGKPPHPW